MEYLFGGWVKDANPRFCNFACEGGVYVILIKRVCKTSHKGHINLTKLNEIASSISIGFSMCMTYGSGRNLTLLKNLSVL